MCSLIFGDQRTCLWFEIVNSVQHITGGHRPGSVHQICLLRCVALLCRAVSSPLRCSPPPKLIRIGVPPSSTRVRFWIPCPAPERRRFACSAIFVIKYLRSRYAPPHLRRRVALPPQTSPTSSSPPATPSRSSRKAELRLFQVAVCAIPGNMVALKDIVPAASNTVNTRFILLEKGCPNRDGTCLALVADETASVHFQMWGSEWEAFEVGDIIRLNKGIFSYQKNNLLLRAGKKGMAEKVGEFTMLFVETPNMSEIKWGRDPNSPNKFVQEEIISPLSRIFAPIP